MRSLFGSADLLTEAGDCWAYGYDNSRRQALPQAVVFVTEASQVPPLVALCNRAGLPLVARGLPGGGHPP